MNLLLSFVHFRKPPRKLGPFRSVRIDATSARDAANGELIAQHREHQWEVEGERYYRLDASSRVRIRFESGGKPGVSREFGPFARFSSVDGVAYVDERVFAFVDPYDGKWVSYDDGRRWPVMVVSDAPDEAP